MDRRRRSQLKGIVLGFILLVTGIVLNQERLSSLSWPTTTGKVTEAQAKKYTTLVSYDFSVGEKSYTGKDGGAADTKYEVGSELKVFYDARDPSHNALHSFDLQDFAADPRGIPLLMGAIMLIASILSFLFTRSRVRM